ncbi:MAG: YigZ family protein [Candidatus Bipolaricaulota bacterium]
MDAYRTLAAPSASRLTRRRSRFLCTVEPVASAAEAAEKIGAVRREHHDVSHVCYAYRVFAPPEHIVRLDDAGEPTGSAGMPMLRVLEGAELFNVVAVVARVFGGIKLGVGGLARAYADAVAQTISAGTIVERRLEIAVRVRFPVEANAAVLRLVHRYGARVLEIRYDADGAVSVALAPSRVNEFAAALEAETGARAVVEVNP